jgi:Ca2+-binding EF-hand superfamily protein
MAIKYRGVNIDGKREMTMAQFRIWVKTLDADKDGKISKDELSDAVRGNGGWFAGWKAKRGVGSADSNGNGFVDESEIGNLVEFAQKHLGIKII